MQSNEQEQEINLITLAQAGDRKAMDALIRNHQRWIFNIALRMTADIQDAEDITQEIFIGCMKALKSFQFKSTFRTWLYRVAVNRIINLKKYKRETVFAGYNNSWTDDEYVRNFFLQEIPDYKTLPADLAFLVKETMVKCMLAMLLCLKRKQRLIFILSEILSIDNAIVCEIMQITNLNLRKILSRSRKKLYNFINDCCSLVNPGKPCTCEKSVAFNLKNGYTNSMEAIFNTSGSPAIRDIVLSAGKKLDNLKYEKCRELYLDMPFTENRNSLKKVLEIINSGEFEYILNVTK